MSRNNRHMIRRVTRITSTMKSPLMGNISFQFIEHMSAELIYLFDLLYRSKEEIHIEIKS